MNDFWQKANHSWTSDSTRYILTPSKKNQEMFYFIQEIGHFKAFQPYYTEREHLASYLMKYTLSGQGRLHYQGQTYVLEKGDVFLIDCQHYQYYETISDEPWEMAWVHFHGGASSLFYQDYLKNGEQTFKTRTKRIGRIMENLLQLQVNRNARTDFTCSLLLHELLNELVIQKNELDFLETDVPSYIFALQTFLDDHFQEAVTLDSLEKSFMINKYQLNKEFSKYIGTPPIEYLIAKRMNLAKDLLRYTTKPIKEIAMDVGIENTPYFSRLFKIKTGVTPNTYRKNG